MSDTDILSEREVEEIEARIANRPKIGYLEVGIGDLRGGQDAITLITVDAPALCRTVKALRVENEQLRQARHKVSCAANDPYRSLPCDCAEQEIAALRKQLAQVEKERGKLQSRLEISEQERKFAVRYLVKQGYERCTDMDHDCEAWHERLMP